jgi:hypothetical protein
MFLQPIRRSHPTLDDPKHDVDHWLLVVQSFCDIEDGYVKANTRWDGDRMDVLGQLSGATNT